MKSITIEVPVLQGTGLAEDKDWAQEAREKRLNLALESGQSVVLDFGNVDVATQSFVHALIADPFRRGPDAFLERVEFANASPSVKEVILLVIGYLEDAARDAS